MDTKELNQRIDALGKKNAAVEAEIQTLGLETLGHLDQHGDVMPLCRLINVLRRGQHGPFMMWCLAFGKCVKNEDKATAQLMPVRYDKMRSTDIEAATAKPWFEFAEEKEAAIAKAFDLQGATMALIRKAAAAGVDHTKLVAMANIAGISPEKVPASVSVGAKAAELVGEALV